MTKPLAISLVVVALDAMGLGLIMPVLPTLLRELVPIELVPWHYGVLLALYASMQVVFSPLLGRLSDRCGRRPVLCGSLMGATIDYAIMAVAPVFWIIYVGRVISGITGATGAVAASTIADAAPEAERARWFGIMGACFGGGLIAGPALGGVLGDVSVHAPFVAAALLNGIGLVLAFAFLDESQRRQDESTAVTPQMDPFGGFRLNLAFAAAPLVIVFFIMQLIGQVPAALWVIYGEDRFHWDSGAVGLTLATFGVAHMLCQGFAAGQLVARLGERGSLLLGIAADAAGFVLLAFATRNWMVPPILFLLAAGGVGMPALQAMLSKATDTNAQGTLQGVLASLTNLTSVIGPLGITALYGVTAVAWNGWPWLLGAAFYVPCAVILLRSTAGRL